MTAYTYTVTCTAGSVQAEGSWGTTTPPTVTRSVSHKKPMYNLNGLTDATQPDTITIKINFTGSNSFGSAMLACAPMASPKSTANPTTLTGIRKMTTLANPFANQTGNFISLTSNSTTLTIATQSGSTNTVNGRWHFSMDILDNNNNYYHLDDPEAQTGTGWPP